MSTIVCQNLESQRLVETTTATLKLRLAAAPPPSPPESLHFYEKQESDGVQEKERTFYTKSSFTKLSAKSLQLCTENLGSETGTDAIAGAAFIFSGENSSAHLEEAGTFEKSNSCRQSKNFPPPLTTISGGSGGLQVRRHREGGRLIIEAVEAPIRSSCFQAERSGGRLKLCMLKSSEYIECGGEMTAAAAAAGGEQKIDEPINEFDDEIGIENYQRMRRCHGNRGFRCDLQPTVCVAIS